MWSLLPKSVCGGDSTALSTEVVVVAEFLVINSVAAVRQAVAINGAAPPQSSVIADLWKMFNVDKRRRVPICCLQLWHAQCTLAPCSGRVMRCNGVWQLTMRALPEIDVKEEENPTQVCKFFFFATPPTLRPS
jgi:hypothetical protein